jgi:hypothetical protein
MRVRLIVWCKSCQHQVEQDPTGQAKRYGPDTPVIEWREGSVLSRCQLCAKKTPLHENARHCTKKPNDLRDFGEQLFPQLNIKSLRAQRFQPICG